MPEARELPLPEDLPDPEEVLTENPELEEVIFPEGRENLPDPTLGQVLEADPELRESLGLDEEGLNGWFLLVPSDPIRGEAQAAADAALGPDGNGVFQSTAEYRVLDVYSFGGEERIPEDAGSPRAGLDQDHVNVAQPHRPTRALRGRPGAAGHPPGDRTGPGAACTRGRSGRTGRVGHPDP